MPASMEMYLTYSQEHKQTKKPRPKHGEGLRSVSFDEAPQTDVASISENSLKHWGRWSHATDSGEKAPPRNSKQGRGTHSGAYQHQASRSSDINIEIK